MDIVLERILMLIPKKENGDFKHGALKEFANSIGLKSGNLISDWVKGRSKSYENYVYQIATIHNVSIEWLMGETNDPTPTGQKETPTLNDEDGLGEIGRQIMGYVCRMSPAQQRAFLASLQAMFEPE